MRISKKILAAVLAALMAISMMPFTVFAAPPSSGDIGTGTGDSIVVGKGNCLTFTGTDSFSINTNNNAKNWNGTLEYSTDANTWTTWDGTSQISSVNNVLYLRGTGNTQITGSNSINRWVITTQGTVACSGDIRTLLNYTEPESSSMGTYCFAYLFNNCTSLTAAPALPATILAESCYSYMFNGCTSLTMAPELPATTLARYCYQSMFNGCRNLTTAPALPATSLESNCYDGMFQNCTNLTTAPALSATSLAAECYSFMFYGCRSLTTAPALPATSLSTSCYSYMFRDCTSLTTAPALPATSLISYCYRGMFQGCTSLTTPSELPATSLKYSCYESMFEGCTGIRLSTEQTAEYSIPYSIPKEGTGSMGTNALTDMFSGTGGTFTGTPTINTTYYLAGPAPVYTDGFVVNGTDHYETLTEAINAAPSDATITMLEDATISSGSSSSSRFAISKSLTFEGNNHTVTINNRGFGVGMNASAPVDVTFKDITITNSTNGGRCVDTRGNLNSLTLDNATLKTTGTSGYLQPLTIGGNQASTATVNVINGSVIQTSDDGSKGYAIITFNPVNMTIDDSTVKGWACIYAKGIDGSAGSAGSTFTITDSTLISKNPNSGLTNAFGTLVVEDSNINFDISDCDISIDGEANHQFLFTNNVEYLKQYVDPNAEIEDVTVALGAGNNVELKAMGDFSVDETDDVTLVISGGTFSAPVPDEFCANGYTGVKNGEGNYGVATTDGYVAKVDGVLYADFEEAVAAARTGSVKTVTLVNDVDLSSVGSGTYPLQDEHYFDITDVTLDLDGHTVTVPSHWGVAFTGTNGTIKNGTFYALENPTASLKNYRYAVDIWGPGRGNVAWSDNQKAEITLENLTCNYGIHVWNADVTVKDCNATGSDDYYAVWSDENSTVTIESGNFTTNGNAVVGAARSTDGDGNIVIEGGNFTVPAGKDLVTASSTSSKPENVQFEGGTAKNSDDSVYVINDINLAPHFVQDMTTGGVYQGEAANETSIRVSDTINEKFYLDKDYYQDVYGNGVYVTVNYNKNSDVSEAANFQTESKAMSSLTVEDGKAVFEVTQAPAQVTEAVTINIYPTAADAAAGTNVIDTVTTSTYEYCRTIITTSEDAKLVALAKATLDYAGAAQTFFGYNTGNMATKDATGDFYGDMAAAAEALTYDVQGFTALPSCVRNATMIVKSNLEINLLANAPIEVENYSIEDATGSAFTAETAPQNGDFYVVHAEGIEPANMNKTITIETTQGTIRFTANTIMKVMASSSNANLATLAKAGYLYGAAAKAYFAS